MIALMAKSSTKCSPIQRRSSKLFLSVEVQNLYMQYCCNGFWSTWKQVLVVWHEFQVWPVLDFWLQASKQSVLLVWGLLRLAPITDLAISLVLKPKKFYFVHQTVSCQEACVGWTQDYTRICHDVPISIRACISCHH